MTDAENLFDLAERYYKRAFEAKWWVDTAVYAAIAIEYARQAKTYGDAEGDSELASMTRLLIDECEYQLKRAKGRLKAAQECLENSRREVW